MVPLNIGIHTFLNQDFLDATLKSMLVKIYDFSAEAREEHDKDAIFKDGVKIKSTEEERLSYWTGIIQTPRKKLRPIGEGEEVANIWIK